MLGRRPDEASPTASGYTLLINAESAEGKQAFTKENWSPRIGRICTDRLERLSFRDGYNPRKDTRLSRKKTPRIGRICTDLWDDVLSGMIIIRGRELKMHERELRGSEVSRGDFNPGVITFDVILILCDSASL